MKHTAHVLNDEGDIVLTWDPKIHEDRENMKQMFATFIEQEFLELPVLLSNAGECITNFIPRWIFFTSIGKLGQFLAEGDEFRSLGGEICLAIYANNGYALIRCRLV
jgi:hypothetical protein